MRFFGGGVEKLILTSQMQQIRSNNISIVTVLRQAYKH